MGCGRRVHWSFSQPGPVQAPRIDLVEDAFPLVTNLVARPEQITSFIHIRLRRGLIRGTPQARAGHALESESVV